jgi:CxxC motif-containing protein (DUF1111 family)
MIEKLPLPDSPHRRATLVGCSLLIALFFAIISILNWKTITTSPPESGTATELVSRGSALFTRSFTPHEGLGPLFNKTSCAGCHSATAAGMKPTGLATSTRIARITASGFDPMLGRGGPVARMHSVAEQGVPYDMPAGIPVGANLTSVRNAPDLHGAGVINGIPDAAIIASGGPRKDGIQGRPNWIRTTNGQLRIGRFGWKADVADLKQFVAEALRNELGITNPLAPADLMIQKHEIHERCRLGEGPDPEDDGTIVNAITAFVAALPSPEIREASRNGGAVFTTIGCSACHIPNIRVGQRQVWLYSDLLLHDLGSELDDSFVQGQARGADWRTTPLWGLGSRRRLLHDGRAHNIGEAILAHGGKATPAKKRFQDLTEKDREALIKFLSSL